MLMGWERKDYIEKKNKSEIKTEERKKNEGCKKTRERKIKVKWERKKTR